jgi:tRNA G18 (ribose-2'-O)-methylase SpoU
MDRPRRLSYHELAQLRAQTDLQYGPLRHPIAVLLWNVRSAYNVGSIFRTCDAVRAEQLILSGYTPTPERHGIHKTALGAEQSVPWRAIVDPFEAITEQRRRGHRIIAVELAEGARPHWTLDGHDLPATFVFGNELVEISEEILAACDDALIIPMFGQKHSLNVAVSVGVVLYRAVEVIERQRYAALQTSR